MVSLYDFYIKKKRMSNDPYFQRRKTNQKRIVYFFSSYGRVLPYVIVLQDDEIELLLYYRVESINVKHMKQYLFMSLNLYNTSLEVKLITLN